MKRKAEETKADIDAQKDIAIARSEGIINRYINQVMLDISKQLKKPELASAIQDQAKLFQDPINKLQWAIPKVEPRTWNRASEYSKFTRINSHSDWRLPAIDETKQFMNFVKNIKILEIEKGYYWTQDRQGNQATIFNPFSRTPEFDQDDIVNFNWIILLRNS